MQESRAYGFRGLISWQKSQQFAADCCTLIDLLPRKRSADILGSQLIRSAASVPANIAEGYGRYSAGAFRNHLSIARGSLMETESHIDLLMRAGLVSEAAGKGLQDRCREIGRILTAQMKSLQGPSAREEGPEYDI